MDNRPTASRHSFGENVESRVAMAAVLYQELCEAGKRPNREEFLAQHREVAAQLESCLDAIDFMAGAAPRDLGAAHFEAPRELGEFRILRQLGRGGMGVVYEAEQASLQRRVALKVLPTVAALDDRALQRFQHESQAAASLQHPHIVPIYAVGQQQGLHYFAMQLIEGVSLASEIKALRASQGKFQFGTGSTIKNAGTITRDDAQPHEDTPLNSVKQLLGGLGEFGTPAYFAKLAQIMRDVALALQHAHEVGVIHRDIKPANLLLDRRGKVWVTDFGLAKLPGSELTGTADVMGTLRYMAPEQASGKTVSLDARSDVYSLGTTLYELVTLRRAFEAEFQEVLLRKVLTEEPAAPRKVENRVPRDLETIIVKAMTKEPAARYSSAKELAEDLERFFEDKPIQARRVSITEKSWRWCRQNRVVASLAILVVGLLSALAAVQVVKNSQLSTALGNLNVVNEKLGKSNSQLSSALKEVETANQKATERLFQSYLDQLRLGHSDATPGARQRSLDVITTAAKMKPLNSLRSDAFYFLGRREVVFATPEVLSKIPKTQQDEENEQEGHPFSGARPAPNLVVIFQSEKNGSRRKVGDIRGTFAKEFEFQRGIRLWDFSPDGKYLALGVYSYFEKPMRPISLQVWDWKASKLIAEVKPGSIYKSSKWSTSGKYYLVNDLKLVEIEAASGTQRVLSEFKEEPVQLTFSPDESLLAVTMAKEVRFLTLKTGKTTPPPIACNSATRSVAWTNTWFYVVENDSTARFFRSDDLRPVRNILLNESDSSSELAPQGDLLISAFAGGVSIWDVNRSEKIVDQFQAEYPQNFVANGRLILAGGVPSISLGDPLECWQREFGGWLSHPKIVGFSKTPPGVLISGVEGTELWDLDSRKRVWRTKSLATAAAVLPDGANVLTWSPEQSQWAIESIKGVVPGQAHSRKIIQGPSIPKSCRLIFAQIIESSDLYLGFGSVESGEKTQLVKYSASGEFVHKEFAQQNAIKLFLRPKEQQAIVFGMHTNAAGVSLVDMHSKPHELMVVDGTVRAIDLTPNTSFGVLETIIPNREFRYQTRIVGGEDLGVLGELPPRPNTFTEITVSPDGKMMCGFDGSHLELTELHSKRVVARWKERLPIRDLKFTPDGRHLVLLCESSFRVWDLEQTRRWLKERGLDWGQKSTGPSG